MQFMLDARSNSDTPCLYANKLHAAYFNNVVLQQDYLQKIKVGH